MAKLVIGKTMVRPNYEDKNFNFDRHFENQEKQMKSLQAASDKALKAGKMEGLLFSFGVGDGYATYRVVKESPLTVEHLYYMDGYQVHPATIRGLRKEDIIQLARPWFKAKAMKLY